MVIDTEEFLNKQGLRREAINHPAMGKQWVDVKKPAVSPKFSLANRAATEIFGVCWVFFLASGESQKKYRLCQKMGTKQEMPQQNNSLCEELEWFEEVVSRTAYGALIGRFHPFISLATVCICLLS